jgi:hypothetical protein
LYSGLFFFLPKKVGKWNFNSFSISITAMIFKVLSKFSHELVQETRINNPCPTDITNKDRICKNCGDVVGDDSNSDMFCSEQCGVEYEMEHDRE